MAGHTFARTDSLAQHGDQLSVAFSEVLQIDAGDAKYPEFCTEYVGEIYCYLRRLEVRTQAFVNDDLEFSPRVVPIQPRCTCRPKFSGRVPGILWKREEKDSRKLQERGSDKRAFKKKKNTPTATKKRAAGQALPS